MISKPTLPSSGGRSGREKLNKEKVTARPQPIPQGPYRPDASHVPAWHCKQFLNNYQHFSIIP